MCSRQQLKHFASNIKSFPHPSLRVGRCHVALPVLCPPAWEKPAPDVFIRSPLLLSVCCSRNKQIAREKLEPGNELIASLDAEVRNTQLSGRASDMERQCWDQSEIPGAGVPCSVLLLLWKAGGGDGLFLLNKRVYGRKSQKRTHGQWLG